MPGQISIVGFSRFISGISCGRLGHAQHFLLSIFELVTCHPSLLTGRIRAMKISIATDYNSVSDIDRSSLICANYRLIARYRHQPFGSFKQPAGSAGDDETNDGAVEVE